MKLLVALGRFLTRNPAQHVEANQLLQPIRREMAGNSKATPETLPFFFKRIPFHSFLQSLPASCESKASSQAVINSN
jgi:hypothetical protein